MVDLITPKHSHLKKQATGVPKKDFRSFLKKQKVQAKKTDGMVEDVIVAAPKVKNEKADEVMNL